MIFIGNSIQEMFDVFLDEREVRCTGGVTPEEIVCYYRICKNPEEVSNIPKASLGRIGYVGMHLDNCGKCKEIYEMCEKRDKALDGILVDVFFGPEGYVN